MKNESTTARLLNIIVALAIALVALCAALGMAIYQLSQQKVQGYAATDTGRVIALVPLDQPYVTDARVTGFVDECLRQSFAHDFENFRMTMSAAKTCYTPSGATEFEEAMVPLLRDLQQRSLVMSSTLDPPVVTRVFKINGIVHWGTQTQLSMFRRGGRETLVPVKFRIDAIVQRIPLDANVRGIALRSIVLTPI